MTARKYLEKPVDKWTTNDFLDYIVDRHFEVYGTEYTPPGRNWQVERGLIGNLIGTRGKNAKPRKYPNKVVKAFIDECFRNHKCTPQYPTVSFTWLWKWKTAEWARVLAEHARKERAQETSAPITEETIEWL
ncbi:hypothetical protein V7149_00455 [Bacillus sp. JJ1503]|uniref:hypothetical protein n=1 Tax=Bacillus sp. JJ1503 TaxID=3122956 RepID=UPI00300073E4